MAVPVILGRTYAWADRHSTGTNQYKNIYATSFGYTDYRKKVAAGTNTAIMAATAGASTAQTITSGLNSVDVPRVLSLTVGGSSAGVQSSSVVVTGRNIEGKVITDTFNTTAGTTGTINGTKAFLTITSVFIPAQVGTSATFAIGTTNAIGVRHRLFKNNTTVKVYSTTAHKGALTLQGVPTVTASAETIEVNTVTPLTTPDGTTFLIICYVFDNWALKPFQDQPEYSTTTSTSSTSSSTSTTTITTSTSSTSISTSSTSSSVSSTSISTSSTSSSTTTAP